MCSPVQLPQPTRTSTRVPTNSAIRLLNSLKIRKKEVLSYILHTMNILLYVLCREGQGFVRIWILSNKSLPNMDSAKLWHFHMTVKKPNKKFILFWFRGYKVKDFTCKTERRKTPRELRDLVNGHWSHCVIADGVPGRGGCGWSLDQRQQSNKIKLFPLHCKKKG